MGGGWGHLVPLRSVAKEFARRGCEVVVLCRDGEKARRIFSGTGIAVEQSPAWTLNKTGFSLNYAQNLWGNGYWDIEMFGSHFDWWSDRLRALRPGYVLADYAPTALLAALSLNIPRGAMGTGFTLPPMATPMPSLHPWLESPVEALADAEDAVLGTIRSRVPSVRSVAGIFQGAERFLTIFPELDHFETRATERYFGPVFGSASGHELAWPDGSGPRVFVYLTASNRCLTELINHLTSLELPVVGHIRDLPESGRKAMESATLRLSGSLLDLDHTVAGCDIAVTQGGLHTSARMLLSGARLLICPEQLEQTLQAYQLNKRGLCEWVSVFSAAHLVKQRFETVASSAELGWNTAAFAARHTGYDPAETVREIVRTCLKAI